MSKYEYTYIKETREANIMFIQKRQEEYEKEKADECDKTDSTTS
jgi:hypothetical protein